uniref:Uncharacterized protein n=1 Tax=Ditylenchus dipsaci TaxID=166011 RepID=A0A915EUU9_9BILA
MAAYGCGKTMLVNFLLQRGNCTSKISGSVRANGSKSDKHAISKVIPTLRISMLSNFCVFRFMPAKGILIASTTIVEALRFKSVVRNPLVLLMLKKEKRGSSTLPKYIDQFADKESASVRDNEHHPIDWARKYLELHKQCIEKDKTIQHFLTAFKETISEKDKAMTLFRETISEFKETISEAAVTRTELKYANDEILRLHSMLSARGAIELYEKKNNMPMTLRRDGSRKKKWQHIYDNNSAFRHHVKLFFGIELDALTVGDLAEKVRSTSLLMK